MVTQSRDPHGRYRGSAYNSDAELFPSTDAETIGSDGYDDGSVPAPASRCPVIPQILSEVQMLHVFKNEGEGVFPSGMNDTELLSLSLTRLHVNASLYSLYW